MPEPVITSRQNPRVKEACALRNRKERDRTGQTLVYGVRESARARAAGAKLLETFYCPTYTRSDDAVRLIIELAADGVLLHEVTSEVFEKLAYGDRYDGVVSVVATHVRGLTDLQLPAQSLIAVIEQVEKPGNLGAMLRSADGAGVDAVVVADPVIDLFNPNTIRASVAAVFNNNVAVATAMETIAWLRVAGLAMWAARPEAEQFYYDADLTRGGAVVLGSEAAGLSPIWQACDVTPIALPMLGTADSLNVAATAAVLFYEARRQRDLASGR